MAQSHIIDQDPDIQSIQYTSKQLIICVLVLGKVHGECADFDILFVGRFDLCGERFELRLCAGDEEEIVAFSCELEGELFADAVGGAGYDCVCAFGCVFSELDQSISAVQVMTVYWKPYGSAWQQKRARQEARPSE
jgi:hypothetical protein